MKIGILTAPFKTDAWPLEKIIEWAGANAIDCIEILVPRHLDIQTCSQERLGTIRQCLKNANVTISSLAYYNGKIADPAERQAHVAMLTAAIRTAEALGVDTVCTLAGMQMPGKSKMDTIKQDLPALFGPVLAEAERRNVRIALENWFATNIQHLEHWKALFEVLPQKNFGLNFDPSHLHWQGIDYMAAVEEFRDRIFHTHAKDVAFNEAARRRVGVMAEWWRYTIPGTGRIAWGEYIGKLRQVGYNGVLSIEHEDKTLSPEAGFIMGSRFLRQIIA